MNRAGHQQKTAPQVPRTSDWAFHPLVQLQPLETAPEADIAASL